MRWLILLARTGGSNNDIFIWDINSLDKPMAPGAKPTQSQADIMGVAWNKHVSHIMASTSVDGMSVVWDLRQSRPIIRFSESSAVKSRCVAVEWSPDAATQLVTASEEDRLPVIQVWDLRNAYSPLRTLEKHTRGVLALAWCPKDADMLVTCGKDNRTLIWNPNADVPGGEVVAELPPSMNWNFDVQVGFPFPSSAYLKSLGSKSCCPPCSGARVIHRLWRRRRLRGACQCTTSLTRGPGLEPGPGRGWLIRSVASTVGSQGSTQPWAYNGRQSGLSGLAGLCSGSAEGSRSSMPRIPARSRHVSRWECMVVRGVQWILNVGVGA